MGSFLLPRNAAEKVIVMPSGGSRRNSGPAPDPNALRRDRKDDAAWVVLPAGGFDGEVPEFPLPRAVQFETFFEDGKKVTAPDADATVSVWEAELDLWSELWRKPQAAMWSKLDMHYEVAAYVRAFLESVRSEASAGLKTAVLRMAGEIGLSLPGMHSLRWKFSVDELQEKRAESASTSRSGKSARERLRLIENA